MWVEVFRAGNHTDSAGKATKFTATDLQTIADNYNEAVRNDISYQAPLVKGHPETDAPALGWISSLRVEGEKMFADATGIDNSLIRDIRNGRYRNISISLDPGGKLRHIGVLGAARPAVKGMQPLRFIEYTPSQSKKELYKKDLTEEEQTAIRTLTEENQELRNQLSDINKKIAIENRIKSYSEKLSDLSYSHTPVDVDTLFRNLAIIENQAIADDIIDVFAKISAEKIATSEKALTKKEFSTSGLSSEYNLGFTPDKITDRKQLDEAIRKELASNPSLTYEECLGQITGI